MFIQMNSKINGTDKYAHIYTNSLLMLFAAYVVWMLPGCMGLSIIYTEQKKKVYTQYMKNTYDSTFAAQLVIQVLIFLNGFKRLRGLF